LCTDVRCIGGNGWVIVKVDVNATTTFKQVKDLEVNDMVQSLHGWSTIDKVYSSESNREMASVNGVVLTADHPICVDGRWSHPADSHVVFRESVQVYNFVMKADPSEQDKHTLIVRASANDGDVGVVCATMGCGPKELATRFPDADKQHGKGFWKTRGQ